jgi:PAS domain-containing protein
MSCPVRTWLLDRNHCYVAVNQAYEQVVMRSRDEMFGRNLFDLFPNDGESGRRLRESFDRVIETGETDTLAYIPYDIPAAARVGRRHGTALLDSGSYPCFRRWWL